MNANMQKPGAPDRASDRTTRRLCESILAQVEEHADDLVDLVEDLPKD